MNGDAPSSPSAPGPGGKNPDQPPAPDPGASPAEAPLRPAGFFSMRLRIPLILFFSLVGFAAVYYLFFQRSMSAQFTRLAEERAVGDLSRCVDGLRREQHRLDALCAQLASSRETYDMVAQGESRYGASALVPRILTGVNVELIYFLRADGKTVFGRIDAPDHSGDITLSAFPPVAAFPPGPLTSDGGPAGGFLVTEAGIMLLASRPVPQPGLRLGPDGAAMPGEAAGRLILGRFLSDETLAGLREQVREFFFVAPLPAKDGSEAASDLPGDGAVTLERAAKGVLAQAVVRDIYGRPAIAVFATFPEDASLRGRAALDFGFASVVAAGCFILLALWLILDVSLVRPLAALTGQIAAIRRDRDLSRRVPAASGDEIGVLARAFNGMMDEIEEARAEVRDQAFKLGMAEMASGVLHNVRNSLTPFTGHLQLARRSLDGSALPDLRRAVSELATGNPAAGRRDDLFEFTRLAVDDTLTRLAAASARLEKMSLVTKKIETILIEQGRSGPAPGQDETIALAVAVREALTLVPDGHLDCLRVDVDESVVAAPFVLGNAVILQQVFANIVSNAAEAAARAKTSGTVLTVTAETGGAPGTVTAVFADNGPGFDPELAGRLFERGFSMKVISSGLGLHWCANVVAAMGGRVSAASPGPGQGATFRVSLRARSAT